MTRCVCAVSSCRKSSYVHNQLKFIRIPSAPNICKQWLRLIGQPEYKCRDKHNMYICEEHFKPEDRTDTKMRPNVLPSLHLPAPSEIGAQPSTRVMANKGTQYRAPGSSGAATMKKSIGYKSPKQQRLEKKAQFEKLCDEFLSRDVSNLVRLQVEIKKQFHKDKYFKDFKYFCLKFYYTSPASYIALQTYYNLSDVKGLLRSCLSFAVQDPKPFLATLCSKIDCMTDLEKNCAVLISEVDLKPHLYYNVTEDKIYGYCESTEQTQNPQLARRAIILMARGLYGRWVLPIDYGLFYEKDDGPIKKWVMSVLERLISAGLKIRSCVSNMSSKVLIAEDQHTVCIGRPFFSVSQSIYYVYDPTYLVTKVLNYLLDHDIHFDGCVAKWADLVYFYESDSKKALRLAPKLSVKHIKPNDGKMDACVAVETLSESVAAGISAYIDFGQMDESARGTVQLLVMMNRLYKFMSSSNASNTCEYQKPQSGSDFQTKFVIEALGFFRRLKLLKDGVDVTQNVKIFQEIQIAIRAEVLLYEDLMMENLPNLCNNTMRLNILDKFLNRIREKSKLGDITVWRLISAHRKMLLRNFSKTGKQKNCPKAVSEMFEKYLKSTRFGSFSYAFDRVPAKKFKLAALILPVKISEYKNLKLPREHKIIHITMFLLEKCFSMHETCNLPQPKQILKTEDFSRACAVFELDLNADHQRIPIPDNNMINFVEVLEQNLKRQFATGLVINQPFKTLSATAEQFVPSYEPPCQCFPVLYFIKLFYRLRISQILKDANRSNKECSSGSDMQFQYIQLE